MIQPFKQIQIGGLVTLRVTTFQSTLPAFKKLMDYPVQNSKVSSAWSDESEGNTLMLEMAQAIECEGVKTIGEFLTFASNQDVQFKFLNTNAIISKWLSENCSDYYNVDVYMKTLYWIGKFTRHEQLSVCYYHNNGEGFPMDELTLPFYTSEFMRTTIYPNASVNIGGVPQTCYCLNNVWKLFSKMFIIDYTLKEIPELPFIKDLDVASILKSKMKDNADNDGLIKFFIYRLFGAIEIEFFNRSLINEAKHAHHLDTTDKRMTGIDLGMSVKSCSEEITQVANAIGLIAKIGTVSHHVGAKPSLAIVILHRPEEGSNKNGQCFQTFWRLRSDIKAVGDDRKSAVASTPTDHRPATSTSYQHQLPAPSFAVAMHSLK